MQTDSKYNIRTQYVSFLNPKSTKTEPNVTLRTFILDWVKDGKELSGSLIAREYTKKTGSSVTRQRVEALIKQLGAKTLRKIRNGVLILMLMGSLAAAQLSLRPATELALQIPQVRQWVYPQKAYAVEPSISISVPEGVVEIAQVASTSAGQTLPTPTPSVSWNEFVEAVDKVAPMYHFPKNVVLAQGALESGRGSSNFAIERNNYLGIGAFDSDPSQAFHYENAEQCVVEYMRLIKKNFPEAWANRDNPDQLLYHLKHNKKGNMYATDPNYIAKVKSMQEWE